MTNHWDDGEGSAELNLDFGGVKSDREPIPEGVYLLRVDGAPRKKVTKNGNEQVSVMLRVQHDRKGNDEYNNKVVWDNWMLLPQSRWWMQQALEALTGESWSEDNMKLSLKELAGLQAWATVIIDGSFGTPKNKISKWHTEPVEAAAPAMSNPEVPF